MTRAALVTDVYSKAEAMRPAPIAEAGTSPGAVHQMDVVFINGFTGSTVIGINHDELHEPQSVRLDLAIGVPRLRACCTDRIEDTIDYSAVHAALHHLLCTHRMRLLEALAEAIAQLTIAEFGAHWVRVSLAKPAKFDDVEAVGVTIERVREARASSHVSKIIELIGAGSVPG
jgi:dihydroneopterin aldolase